MTRRPIMAKNYPVVIDYSDSFQQRLDAGRYDWKNSDITEKHFPVKGEGRIQIDLDLMHFDRRMKTENVLAAIEAQGYRPATIEELLAFGATYSELQREFPIVALGAVWQRGHGDRRVATLCKDRDRRHLDFSLYYGGAWESHYRFLVVRKAA